MVLSTLLKHYYIKDDKLHESTEKDMIPAHNMLQQQELLGTQVAQWESFLVDMPLLVLELGRTVVTSNLKDFSLVQTGVAYKHLKHPASYRACLRQVC